MIQRFTRREGLYAFRGMTPRCRRVSMEIDKNNNRKSADDLFEEVVEQIERLKTYPDEYQLEFANRIISAVKTRSRRSLNEVQDHFQRSQIAGAEIVPLRVQDLECIINCWKKLSGP